MVKNRPANAGDIRDMGSIPGLGRSPGGGHGNPFQYSCLEESHGQIDKEAIWLRLNKALRIDKKKTRLNPAVCEPNEEGFYRNLGRHES